MKQAVAKKYIIDYNNRSFIFINHFKLILESETDFMFTINLLENNKSFRDQFVDWWLGIKGTATVSYSSLLRNYNNRNKYNLYNRYKIVENWKL